MIASYSLKLINTNIVAIHVHYCLLFTCTVYQKFLIGLHSLPTGCHGIVSYPVDVHCTFIIRL